MSAGRECPDRHGAGDGPATEPPWDSFADDHSAEASRILFYTATNRALVTAGCLQPGMRIVDLACGSGLTTQAILAAIPGQDCQVYAVDSSAGMLRNMRRVVTVPSVHLIHAEADDFVRFVPEQVDRVFCNAALWHFGNTGSVLREVRTVLRPGGLFLFNLPDHEFDFGDGWHSHMEALILTALGQPPRQDARSFNHERIRGLAAEAGLAVLEFGAIDIDLRREDLVRLCRIPPIGAPGFPGRSRAERERLVQEAFAGIPAEGLSPYRWAQFTLQRPHG